MSTEAAPLTEDQQKAISQILNGPNMARVSQEAKFALTGWGKKAMEQEFDVRCPSGQWCRVKKIKFEDLLGLGILDNLDLFSSMLMAQSGDEGSAGKAEVRMLESFRDPEKRAKFMGTVNKVVSAGVVLPKVVLVDDGSLPDDTVFAGDIDFQDKMFLFGLLFQGRAGQLKQFRDEQDDDLGDVAEGQSVPQAAP